MGLFVGVGLGYLNNEYLNEMKMWMLCCRLVGYYWCWLIVWGFFVFGGVVVG